jgi:dTDP-4-dehydrorhamnose reductase
MSAKRIMLLGAQGQIGQAVRAEPLPADWQIGAFAHADLDIAQHQLTRNAMLDFRPDLIINAAAMTNVDEAEKNHEHAMAVNFEAIANLAALCSARDIPLIHLSTDYVFDGHKTSPYRPEDPMHPLNAYGESKMMGEEALRHELAWHVILRVSAVFSAFGKNMLTKMLTMIDARDELTIVTDQKSCPTYAPDIAKAIIVIATALLKGKHDGFGTFHLCGTPEAARFEFVQAILELYAPYAARRPKMIPVLSADIASAAPRPAYSALDCTKIRDVYGITQKPWREGMAEAMATLMRERRKTA